MKKTNILMGCALAVSILFSGFSAKSQNLPFPQNKVYSYGLMPTNRSSSDALTAYNVWKTNFVESCGSGRYRVRFDNPSETVSEGIAYGMLLSAYAGDRTIFDGLWNYYRAFSNSRGFMHWKIAGCTSVLGQNGATDSDEDAAMALIVAHAQWGSTGAVNYESSAKTLINAMKMHEVEAGTNVLKPGDAFGGSSLTNPSYFAPGYYRTFAAFTGDASWNSVAAKAYEVINNNLRVNGAVGGLVSDWTQANGSYSSQAGGYADGGRNYSYDAARTPWRIAVDYAWYGNADAKAYIKKSSDFVRITVGGSQNVKAGYTQKGVALAQWHNSTFVGAFASAAIGGEDQAHLNNSYADLKGINDASSYFNQTLKALYLFFLTGNFYLPGATPTPVNNAPTVSLTSPLNNATFTAPATITLSANATDSDGSITRVEFFQGTTKIGEDLTAPYSISWGNVAAGTYTITARATDNGGKATTSTAANISVTATANRAPSVSLTSPLNNASFTAPATITLSANATDADGTISRVEFFQGSTKIGEDLTSPYSISWNNVAAGSYSITARATDNGGAATTSTAVSISVTGTTNRAPSISLTSPLNNASFTAPATITLSANATDADGTISRVEFFQGSTKIGEDLTSPYSISWNNVAAGSYSITARATDNGGAATTSTAVSITVTRTTTTCPVTAIPAASGWTVRNDWSDQNNGSSLLSTTEALQITHRPWGRAFLWLIESRTRTVSSGTTYTISFDFKNDPTNPVSSIDVGFASSTDWAGASWLQTPVNVTGLSSSSYTTKSVSIPVTSGGNVYVAFRLNWPSQPNARVVALLKNLAMCGPNGTSFRIAEVEESYASSNYIAVPNPFETTTSLRVNESVTVPMKLTVTDIAGRVVFESTDYSTNENVFLGEAFQSGVYTAKASFEGKAVAFKLIKK